MAIDAKTHQNATASKKTAQAGWTPRRRVRTAMERNEPDRVPLALGGSYYGLHDKLYFQMLDVLGLSFDPEHQFRQKKGHTVNYHDDRVLEALGIDVRYVWLGSTDINSPDFSGCIEEEEVEAADLYGVGFRKTGLQVQVVPGRFPIRGGMVTEDAATYDLSQVENYEFPRVAEIVRVKEMQERTLHLARNTSYALVARAPNSFGIFEQSCHLIGHEDLYMAIALNKPLVHLLAERLKNFFIDLYDVYLSQVGPYIDVVELPGDDFSGTGLSMVSKDHYYEFYLEPWREVIAFIRSKAPNAKILFHCDGVIMEFVRPFIDAGADIINSVETDVGNDITALKRDYGDQVAFWGALNVKRPLQKGKADIERDIDEKMRILKPGGGWVLANENHAMPDIPAENLLYAYEYAAKVGSY